MSYDGCECQDSFLWAFEPQLPFPANPALATMYVPLKGFGILQFSDRSVSVFSVGNIDSFIVFQNAVTTCDTAVIDPNAKVAYASGVFTSDSTGIMHLDWYKLQDTVPYRRCSMPFTRIR